MTEKTYKQRQPRKSFGLPVVLSVMDSLLKLPARLNNISEGGLNFNSNALFPDGEILELEVPYPKEAVLCLDVDAIGTKAIRLKVRVVWSKTFQNPKDPLIKYVHGCQFVQDPDGVIRKGVEDLMSLSEKLGQKPMGF